MRRILLGLLPFMVATQAAENEPITPMIKPYPRANCSYGSDPEALQSPKSRKNRKAMRAAKQRRLTLKRLPK